MASKVIYVKVIDHTGQHYVTQVDEMAPATGASLETKRTTAEVLAHVRSRIVTHQAIECEIVHPNNRARVTVMFLGPVTLAVFR